MRRLVAGGRWRGEEGRAKGRAAEKDWRRMCVPGTGCRMRVYVCVCVFVDAGWTGGRQRCYNEAHSRRETKQALTRYRGAAAITRYAAATTTTSAASERRMAALWASGDECGFKVQWLCVHVCM